MDIILDLRKGMIRDHTGKSIVGLRVKCNQKSPIAIQIDGFSEEVAVSLIAKKAGQTLAFWEGKVKEQQEIIIDFDTQEIREAMAQTNELEASLEFKVESQDSEAVYLSQTLGLWLETGLFDDFFLPNKVKPQWKIMYDEVHDALEFVKDATEGFTLQVGQVIEGDHAEARVNPGDHAGSHVLDFMLPRGGSPYPGSNGNWWNDLGDTGVPVHQDVDLSHLVPKTELQKTLEGYAKPAELTDDEFTLLPSKDANGIYFIK